ncbi:unnamed protein product, partial [Meganyctiphanes norvegica]
MDLSPKNSSASVGRTIISTTMRDNDRKSNPMLHHLLMESSRKNMQVKSQSPRKGFSVNIQTNTNNIHQGDKEFKVDEKGINLQSRDIKFEINLNGNSTIAQQDTCATIINNQEMSYQIPEADSQISSNIAMSTTDRNFHKNVITVSKENLQIVAKEKLVLSKSAAHSLLRSKKEKDKKYTTLVK